MKPRSDRASGLRLLRGGLLVVFVVLSTSALSLGVLVPVLPLFFSDMGASASFFGLLFAAYSGIEGIFEGVWGWASDSIGSIPIIISRMFILAGLLFLFTRFEGLIVLSILMLVRGVFEAPVWPLGRAYIGQSMAAQQRGMGMALVQSVIVAGMSIGSQIGGIVKDTWGYNTTFFFALSLLLVGGAVVVIGRKNLTVSSSPGTNQEERRLSDGSSSSQNWRKRLGIIGIVVGFATLGFITLIAFVPIYADRIVGLDGVQIGSVMMVSGLASLAVMLPAGRLCDRSGRKSFIIGGLVLQGLAIAAIAFAGNFWALLACVTGAAAGRAAMLPATLALASEVMPPGLQGRAMGLVGVGEAVGMMVGPAAAGLIWDSFGASATFWFTGAIVGFGAVVTLRFIRERQWLGIPKLVAKSSDVVM